MTLDTDQGIKAHSGNKESIDASRKNLDSDSQSTKEDASGLGQVEDELDRDKSEENQLLLIDILMDS